ncbi:MarR family winged helix-turn-helix transcriptional regulator [Pseudonocardia sp. H11422]|uniref:MarR family winged helix-turn-helix transcriptional regulator n=1 Tax=Pseudonocardia sp. H11422 TaxID=2835866 RepID=UPI001BDCEAE8|nr:MarR family winged helix-turn-helix transcriptional regulator [Pseudonocardia sp. H11422]
MSHALIRIVDREGLAVPRQEGTGEEADLAGADRIGTELIRLIRLLERAYAQYQAEHPDAVERATYHLLVHLVNDGPHRSSALAEAVHSDPSTVSRQIGHLVRLGLVERRADPADGRATLLAATDEGRRVFEENRKLRNEKIAAMIAHWSPSDRQHLAALLARFTTDFENYRSRSADPGPGGGADVTAADRS